MKQSEAESLVRKTIEELKKCENGALPPTPYVVAEVGRRLATVKTWEGRAAEPLLLSIRKLVEKELQAHPAPKIRLLAPAPIEEDEVPVPLVRAQKLRQKWSGATAR